MWKEATVVLWVGVLLYLYSISSASSLSWSSTDESTLLSLKENINSDMLAKNWTQGTSFCTWIGVRCSQRHPRVTGLDLSNMRLQGTIAREIGNLSFLKFLDVSNNSISGSIPAEIGNLKRLRALDMTQNELSGHIPQSLGLLRTVKHLNLSNNYLSGDIPRNLSECIQLNILDLSYNNLTGNIPVEFGNLSRLQLLFLRSNQLTGDLPSTIFNIPSMWYIHVGRNQMSGNIPTDLCTQPVAKLEELALHSNQFEGEIPSSLTRCHSLKFLSMARNKFTGSIPSDLWNLSAIQAIGLARNQLTGTIPSSIGNLSNLEIFDISENSFYGTIPPEIGQLSSLKLLNLGVNKLNGEIPQSIFNSSRLQIFSVAYNNLSGYLPFSIDKGLPYIEEMYLHNNQFDGKIPESISNLSRVTILQFSTNSFNGVIPTTLGSLSQLQILNLADNQLTNNMSKPEQDFLTSLTACKQLKAIRILFNPMSGVLPKSLGSRNLSASLKEFLADSCRIISPLPSEIGNLSTLISLRLGDNDLTGAIPTTLWHLTNLQMLRMQGNKLQGSISHDLCNLKNLYLINLARNYLSGELPSCIGNLSSLGEFYLAENAFSSSIPLALWFNKRVSRMNFSNNFLEGPLPQEIGNVMSLIELDLSGNKLYGEIPISVSQLQNLIFLSLSNNRLDGSMFESFVDLKDLQHLDLSNNNLSGPIPKSLEKLPYLNYFNVSFNNLIGEIPDKGPFLNFTADFFRGNKGLCGSPQFKVETCKRSKPASSSKNRLVKYILPATVSAVVVVFIIFILVKTHVRMPSSRSNLAPGFMYERISYYEILQATSNLNEEQLIGKGSFGSVYKGNFPDGMIAAVKVFNLDVQGATKSFGTECQILRSIRHRNLVKVITSCSNLDFKALIMAYMPNGNLEKWLYSANCTLDMFKRLEVMIDVASALEYLHEGYTFPIVHCDLKPSNILLDEDMIAHVSDFGIAKLLTQEQRMEQTRTLGTIGYMAPEYGSGGLISTMVDVYSYGILLMEIFSRKKPTDEMFLGELTMRRWVSHSFPNSAMQIIDNELLNMDDERTRARHESCFRSTIQLALECSADMPEERPNIKDVLARIKKIKLNLSNPY